MDEETRAAVKDALVREAIGLGALFAILWIMGPGRTLVPAWIARAKVALGKTDPFEGEIRQFSAQVSRWDHEQASSQDRKAAPGGGCGCGGLRSSCRHRPDPA